jgi:hypothetical protein
MYYHSYYENDMHMGELYVKRRVAEYKKINFNDYVDIKKKMVDAYMKIYFEYVIDKFPLDDPCYYKIRQHYIEHNGIEPPNDTSLAIKWDEHIQSWDDFKRNNPDFKGNKISTFRFM